MQGKSDTDLEYWRSKMGNPVRAEEPAARAESQVVRDRLPAAVVFSTMLMCVTAMVISTCWLFVK